MSEDAERLMRGLVAEQFERERHDARWRFAMTCRSALTFVFGVLAVVSSLLRLDLGLSVALIGLAAFAMGATLSMGWKP